MQYLLMIDVNCSTHIVLCKFSKMYTHLLIHFQLVNNFFKLEYFHLCNSIFNPRFLFLFLSIKLCQQQSLALTCDAVYLFREEGVRTQAGERLGLLMLFIQPLAQVLYVPVPLTCKQLHTRSSFTKKNKGKRLNSNSSLALSLQVYKLQRLKVVRWQPYKKDYFQFWF